MPGLRRLSVLLTNLALALLLLAALLWFRPRWIAEYWAPGPGTWLPYLLARLTGFLPFSLAEFILLSLPVAATGFAIRLVLDGRRGTRLLRPRLAWGLRLLIPAALLATALFYLCWGLHYGQPALVERMGWQAAAETPLDDAQARAELEALCRQLVVATNRAYIQAHGDLEWRQGMAPIAVDEADRGLEEGFVRLGSALHISEAWLWRRGRAKPLLVSNLASHFGLTGFYFPWTGEANFNRAAPEVQIPHTLAHEKAHQRGVASEDEASFVGYLACLASQQPYVRYSGLLFAQQQLLGELFRLDRETAIGLATQRVAGVAEDIRAADRYWRGFRGPASRVGERLNDAYLRFHRVEGGIRSYRLSARLLVTFSRVQGGELSEFKDRP